MCSEKMPLRIIDYLLEEGKLLTNEINGWGAIPLLVCKVKSLSNNRVMWLSYRKEPTWGASSSTPNSERTTFIGENYGSFFLTVLRSFSSYRTS
jgi:hypothetical protein